MGDWLPTGSDFLPLRCGYEVLGFACQGLASQAGQGQVPLQPLLLRH